MRGSLPELPAARRTRYVDDLELSEKQARALVDSRDLSELFDDVSELLPVGHRMVANWIIENVVALANERGLPLAEFRAQARGIADVVQLQIDGAVSATAGKQVLDEVIRTGKNAAQVVEEKGLRQVSDTSALETWVDEAIAENPGPVEQFRGGKEGALNAVLGQVMKKSGGSANPSIVRELLLQRLTES